MLRLVLKLKLLEQIPIHLLKQERRWFSNLNLWSHFQSSSSLIFGRTQRRNRMMPPWLKLYRPLKCNNYNRLTIVKFIEMNPKFLREASPCRTRARMILSIERNSRFSWPDLTAKWAITLTRAHFQYLDTRWSATVLKSKRNQIFGKSCINLQWKRWKRDKKMK